MRFVQFSCYSLALALTLTAVGCNGAKDSAHELTVGFVYVGPRDDFGYSQAHAEGAAAVKKMPGVRVLEEERVADTEEVQKTLQSMIQVDGAKVVFATSFNYYDPHVLKLAREYPEVTFLHCGGMWDEKSHPKNVSTYFGYIDECMYLSGIVAAHATEIEEAQASSSGKRIPQVLRDVSAFTLGARSVDPSITCLVVFTNEWSLPIKEADSTNSLINHGVDVMTCHVNSPKAVVENATRRSGFGPVASTPVKRSSGRRPLPDRRASGTGRRFIPNMSPASRAAKPLPNMLRGGLKEGFVKPSPVQPSRERLKPGKQPNAHQGPGLHGRNLCDLPRPSEGQYGEGCHSRRNPVRADGH